MSLALTTQEPFANPGRKKAVPRMPHAHHRSICAEFDILRRNSLLRTGRINFYNRFFFKQTYLRSPTQAPTAGAKSANAGLSPRKTFFHHQGFVVALPGAKIHSPGAAALTRARASVSVAPTTSPTLFSVFQLEAIRKVRDDAKHGQKTPDTLRM